MELKHFVTVNHSKDWEIWFEFIIHSWWDHIEIQEIHQKFNRRNSTFFELLTLARMKQKDGNEIMNLHLEAQAVWASS